MSTGIPSPPPSPSALQPLSSPNKHRDAGNRQAATRKRSGDAAHHITEECERLFCETLNVVFLGEGNAVAQDSLGMGVRNIAKKSNDNQHGLPPTPESLPVQDGLLDLEPRQIRALVSEWVEIWDYAGGLRFRGFVADRDGERALFIFFDQEVMGKDLKHG